jgi:hypothetical protein
VIYHPERNNSSLLQYSYLYAVVANASRNSIIQRKNSNSLAAKTLLTHLCDISPQSTEIIREIEACHIDSKHVNKAGCFCSFVVKFMQK